MSEKRIIPFLPVLADWFSESFGAPTDVQKQAWQSINEGIHTLIAAPTGSGKTLAALLPCLDKVVRTKELRPSKGVKVLYITPLKALNNDIHHHVLQFVEQLEARAAQSDVEWPGIRCEVRTGDTSQSKRAAILRNPPDVLITTPESLFIMLTSDKGRSILETVEQVIVDEIHDLAADKRGAHMSLSLERLAYRCVTPPQRIGVSATQKPLERVARFLGGWQEKETPSDSAAGTMIARPVNIVESTMSKSIRISVTMPDNSKPVTTREEVWQPLLQRIMHAMEGCRSVLLFVNSRRLCERLCLRLNDHVGYEMARSHHGSISRERRLEVERMLKEGTLRCIVATSSLELGIDVGHIDLVIQIDSPLEAARGIQRIGRAGHSVGEASRGLLLARQKAVLPELAVLSRQIAHREIEEIQIPQAPMDVLTQHVTAMVAMEDWEVAKLHLLITHSDSYRNYPLQRLEQMLQVMAGFYPFARPLLDWDRSANRLSKRKSTAMAAITGAGTIPQSGNYPVHHLDSRAHLGELDEEFILECRVGDVFQLGTSSWMVREIRNDRVYVSEAGNRFSQIPFWRNEAGARSFEVGVEIGAFLRAVEERLQLSVEGSANEAELNDQTADWLQEVYGMDRRASEELITLVRSQHHACALPTDRQIVIEHYRDVMNQTHVILHNHFGRKVNRAWLLAIERQFERLLPYRLYGNAKDNGIEFVLPEWDSSWLKAIYHVTPANLEELLTEGISGSPLLGIAFRRIAETSLLLSRSFSRTPLWQKRLRSEALLRDAMPYAAHFPYLREAMSECLHDYLGYDDLKRILGKLSANEMEFVVRETSFPSPFASQFVMDYVNMKIYEGDGVDETIRLQLMSVSKEMAGQLFRSQSMGDAISEEVMQQESHRMSEPERKPTNADELAALLKVRGDLTAKEITKLAGETALEWLHHLQEKGRALPLDLNGDGEYRWINSDEEQLYGEFPTTERSITFVLGRYVDYLLSFTEADLCDRYPALTMVRATQAVELLIDHGLIEQAPHAADEEERLWTSSKVASRLVRLSIRHARSKAEPVEPARWCGQIALMQHALQGTQQQGSDGLRTVIEGLQGLFFPLSHWESIIFPTRLVNYRKEELDLLCASGEVLWIGRKEEGDKEGKIAVFLTSSKSLYQPFLNGTTQEPSKHPRLLQLLEKGGASFLTRLSRDMDKPPSELTTDLLELVWEGRVSNDQFAPLRLHATAKNSRWAKTGSGLGRWYATGMLAEGETHSAPEDKAAQTESPALTWVHHLLKVYGMINKELAAKAAPYSWDTFYPILKQLEEWGAVTRGTFIKGMSTLQFTTRELSDAVRKPLPVSPDTSVTVLSSADPANPFGLIIDWPQAVEGASFARKPGNYLLLKGDRWLYWIENNGKRIFSLPGTEAKSMPLHERAELLKAAFQSIIRRQRLVKISIDLWDGQTVTETDAGKMLLQLGAERDLKSLVFWSN